MINISKISKNLIIVSLISSLMVFWLGSRYLTDAHGQFSGAMQLQRSVIPERTLFEVARSLDVERSTVQRILTSSTHFDDQLEQLDTVAHNTKLLFNRAHQEIENSRPKKSEKIQYRYSNETVENLLKNLVDRFERISIIRPVIISQVYLPPAQRDETMRMQLFDAYVSLIDTVNNLRRKTHALPDENYRGVLSAHDTRDAIWNFGDSVDQISTLIESYLLKTEQSSLDSVNKENLSLRILQQRARANKALLELTDMVQENIITGNTAMAASELKLDYEKNFYNVVANFSTAIANNITPNIERIAWQSISNSTKAKVQDLIEAAHTNILARAESIERSAGINLMINTLLVLLCGAMAYASFRVSQKVQYEADHDDLTGIYNRRKFSQLLEAMQSKTDVSNQERQVLMTIDLNGFKTINDTMGHDIGDKLLSQVAHRLKCAISVGMELARMGGDEFAISYTTKDPEAPYNEARHILDSFDPSFTVGDTSIKICPSIGYSCYPDDADNIEQLQITSDFAMFNAKQSSGKSIQHYNKQIATQHENRIAIEKDLLAALANDEFELHYQPQFNLDLKRVNAAEALLRWNHPTRGMVSPFQFIEIAEDSGLMPAIGDWVFNEACRQAAEWNQIENFQIRIAVNVSVHQITQSNFVTKVVNTMQRNNVSSEHLELEITESSFMFDIDQIVKSLEQLKKLGLKIALDDFGTGYSSLSQLQALPLDALKVDKSFISKLDAASGSTKSVTETIASIARIYDLETVAEGIETAEQLLEVNKLGINIAQGYFYSRPLPKEQVIEAVARINQQALHEGAEQQKAA